MQLLYCLLLLLAAYILLIAAPAVAMYLVVFSKKNRPAPLTEGIESSLTGLDAS